MHHVGICTVLLRYGCHRCAVVSLLITLFCLAPEEARAQVCPEAGAILSVVRNTVNDMGKNDRAPAAADCAAKWAAGLTLDPTRLDEPVVLRFFIDAADLHRRAYEKRVAAHRTADADKYLDGEIALRKRFLDAAVQAQSRSSDDALRVATVRHLSSLAGALARKQQFAEVDKVLANTDASVIDEAAVNVWLQAVWSCAKFDGNSGNLCTPDNRQKCKDKIVGFLSSVDEMKGRRFPPQTARDISKLRSLTAPTGCLR